MSRSSLLTREADSDPYTDAFGRRVRRRECSPLHSRSRGRGGVRNGDHSRSRSRSRGRHRDRRRADPRYHHHHGDDRDRGSMAYEKRRKRERKKRARMRKRKGIEAGELVIDSRSDKTRRFESRHKDKSSHIATTAAGGEAVDGVTATAAAAQEDEYDSDDDWSRTDRKKRQRAKALAEKRKREEMKLAAKRKKEQDARDAKSETAMMAKLGLPVAFDSSKQKEHSDVSGVRTKSKRQYRQYMNRRGGFNKPLAPVF